MKKILIILAVVLVNVLSVVAEPIDKVSIDKNTLNNLVDSCNKFNIFNDSIMECDRMNFHPVYRYLNLKDDQYREFYNIHKDVLESINNLTNKKEEAVELFKIHMATDLRNSYCILDEDQYRKYLVVLNATMNNRDLVKYLHQ